MLNQPLGSIRNALLNSINAMRETSISIIVKFTVLDVITT